MPVPQLSPGPRRACLPLIAALTAKGGPWSVASGGQGWSAASLSPWSAASLQALGRQGGPSRLSRLSRLSRHSAQLSGPCPYASALSQAPFYGFEFRIFHHARQARSATCRLGAYAVGPCTPSAAPLLRRPDGGYWRPISIVSLAIMLGVVNGRSRTGRGP